ncbi:hypothetical protein [Streptomyces sp. NPDC058751]|uniref:hypothetical protein n=1 Tax=Streptomyces sp. NPDC058751 TaxID=3346623 RepID=UPI003694D7DF
MILTAIASMTDLVVGRGELMDGNGPIRRRPWELVGDVVVETVLLELVGLAFFGVGTLVAWLFGWPPELSLAALLAGMLGGRPAVDLYRAGSPRRLAVVAAVLALATVTPLVAAAANRALPASADSGVGILIGFLVAMPVSAAVLAWCLNRANVV